MHYFKTETANWLFTLLGIVWIEEKLEGKRDAETDKVLAEGKKAALDSLRSLYENAKHHEEIQGDSIFRLLRNIFDKPKGETPKEGSVKKELHPRIKPRGLYGKLWERLCAIEKNSVGLVNSSDVYRNLCRSFSITKRECQEVLLILRDFGLIEFKKRGIRVSQT